MALKENVGAESDGSAFYRSRREGGSQRAGMEKGEVGKNGEGKKKKSQHNSEHAQGSSEKDGEDKPWFRKTIQTNKGHHSSLTDHRAKSGE